MLLAGKAEAIGIDGVRCTGGLGSIYLALMNVMMNQSASGGLTMA
jgi:hypothetical protein